MPRKAKRKAKIEGIVGIGLDGTDGERRITRTPEMVLFGGSQETHGRMQETAIRFGEALEKQGKCVAGIGRAGGD
jgi:predicted Rossmann-fold nucleotide-binding protein